MHKVTFRFALGFVVCAAAAGTLAQPVGASGLTPAVVDCYAHARLTRHYTISQLRHALQTMPADVAEYSDCTDEIQRQLYAQIGGKHLSGGSPSGGGSFLPAWLIAALALLALAGVGLAAVAWRRRAGPE
jgi:hypothetical protein